MAKKSNLCYTSQAMVSDEGGLISTSKGTKWPHGALSSPDFEEFTVD